MCLEIRVAKDHAKEYKLYSCLSYKSRLDKNKNENSSWRVYMGIMQRMSERICFKLCKKCGLIGHTKYSRIRLNILSHNFNIREYSRQSWRCFVPRQKIK